MIDSYSFGRIKIDGHEYHRDLLVCKKEIRPWKRVLPHKVLPEDVVCAIKLGPDRIVFGTGKWDKMKVDGATIEKLEESGIRFNISKTGEALKEYNKYYDLEKTVGLFHLTC